jgi:hypothetical protein
MNCSSWTQERGSTPPQTEHGAHAGYRRAYNSTAAMYYLEWLRAKGEDFLLFTRSAFCWWLEHYQRFGRHLDSSSRCPTRQLKLTFTKTNVKGMREGNR